MFAPKYREEDHNIVQDIKTVTTLNDDFMGELSLFIEKQDIFNVHPRGILKTILLMDKKGAKK